MYSWHRTDNCNCKCIISRYSPKCALGVKATRHKTMLWTDVVGLCAVICSPESDCMSAASTASHPPPRQIQTDRSDQTRGFSRGDLCFSPWDLRFTPCAPIHTSTHPPRWHSTAPLDRVGGVCDFTACAWKQTDDSMRSPTFQLHVFIHLLFLDLHHNPCGHGALPTSLSPSQSGPMTSFKPKPEPTH